MIPVSAELAAAIESAEQTVTAVASVDWDGNGHGAAGTVDDLAGQIDGFTIDRVLTDDLPDQVRQVAGSVAAAADVDLSGRLDADGTPLSAAGYWSPFSGSSPIAGKRRIGRDARIGVEFATTAGPQRVQRLAGTTQEIAVTLPAGTARLAALDYRDRLRTPVTLPVWRPPFGGLSAGAVLSYTLWQAGMPLSPPPRAQTRGWWPMHGTAHGFVVTAWTDGFWGYHTTETGLPYGPGPFYLAPALPPRGGVLTVGGYCRTDGPPIRYRDGHVNGRFECSLRLSPPATTATTFDITVTDTAGQQPTNLQVWIGPDRWVWLVITGQTDVVTVQGPQLPNDDGWHFVGVHFDSVALEVRFRIDEATTIRKVVWPAIGYPASTGPELVKVFGKVYDGAVAEMHVCAGIDRGAAWLNEREFTAPAVVLDVPQLWLTGLVPPAGPIEAWEVLRQLAAAELGSVFFDETGRLHYATRARLLSDAAQTVQRTITSADLLLGMSIAENAGTIANTVAVPYAPITVNRGDAWTLPEVLTVPAAGAVDVLVELKGPRGGPDPIYLLLDICTAADGTGTFITDIPGSGTGGPEIDSARLAVSNGYRDASWEKGDLRVTLRETGPTTARLTLTNRGQAPRYVVTPDGSPGARISAQWLTQADAPDTPVVVSPASVDAYGTQPMTLPSSTWRQGPEYAAGVAAALLCDLRDPQPSLVTGISIPGDPRIQFYDRLRIVDTDAGTGLDMAVWVTGVRERLDATGYAMDLSGRPARDVYRVGTGRVGVDLIGGE